MNLDLLEPFAAHPSARVRMMLAHAMWLFGDEQSTRILVRLAHDEDEDVRGTALNAFGWKRFTGGVTQEVVAELWRGSKDERMTIRADAVAALVKLEQPGAQDLFVEELQTAIDRDASHISMYPMVNLLYDELSAFLPSDLREEACRRWAKNIVGKGPPRRG